MVPLVQTVSLLLLALPSPVSAFVFSSPAHQPSRLRRGLPTAGVGRSSEDPAESAATSAFRASLKAFKRAVAEGKPADVRPAVQLLVEDPTVAATRKDAADLLNGVPQLSRAASEEALRALADAAPQGAVDVSTAAAANAAAQGQEAVSRLYRELAARGLLQGFGAVGAGDEPLPNRRVIVAADLPALVGLEQAALTPGRAGTNWLAAGAVLCAAQFAFGEAAGLADPAFNVLPATLLLGAADRALFKGAVFETVLRAAFPEYKTKVVRHEAGHFLAAYLLGCPVESCVLSAWQATQDARFVGAAGTLFFDPELTRGAAKGQVKASTIDRYSIIVMAGIAAEAQAYGQAEGGASDEEAIVSFLTSVQRKQGWTLEQVRDQARWGVVQAALLLAEHKASYEALVACLDQGRPLGDCVQAIEDHLPTVPSPDGTGTAPTLPSLQRRAKREALLAASVAADAAARLASPSAAAAAGGAQTWVGGGVSGATPFNANSPAQAPAASPPASSTVASSAASSAARAAAVKARLAEVEARLAELQPTENP